MASEPNPSHEQVGLESLWTGFSIGHLTVSLSPVNRLSVFDREISCIMASRSITTAHPVPRSGRWSDRPLSVSGSTKEICKRSTVLESNWGHLIIRS